MCGIQIIESILSINTLLFNSCDNIISLRRASIHPEAVTPRWKKSDPIYRLYDVYQSIESSMLLVHVYGNHNSGNLASTLTSLSSLEIRLDALSEHIMLSLLIYRATRTTIAVKLSDPYGLPSVYICRVPVNSNIAQSLAHKISKLPILQYWVDWNRTHMVDWEVIDITSFKRARYKTTFHMTSVSD